MQRSSRAIVVAFMVLGLGGARPAAATRIRPGTISFGFQGTWAFLGGSPDIGKFFTNGPGMEMRVHYRMRHGRVFGATFGESFYQPTTPPPTLLLGDGTTDQLDQLSAITAGLEFGQYFGPNEHPSYVMVGTGIWNPTVRSTTGEPYESNKADHIYLSGTFGTEFFVRRTVTLDVSARVRFHVEQQHGYPNYSENDSPDQLVPELQVGAGVHFYVLD